MGFDCTSGKLAAGGVIITELQEARKANIQNYGKRE